jgi:phosphoesterase RecJ-like protein
MTISHDKIAPLVALLDMPQRVVITIHYNPDGDSLGSSLALYHLLTAKGHSVEILAPNTPPPFYGWLPSFGIVRDFLAETAVCVDLIENATMLFSMDYNELSRAGKMEAHLRNAKVPLVLIDHHPDPEDCTPFLFSDTKVSSASELTYQFIRAMYPNDVLSTKVAECIFTGIMTDTGMFQHNSSRPETFRIVADLLECGIDKDKIKGKVFDTSTTDRLRLTGFCLSEKMVVMPELHAGYIALSMAELARFNFQKGDQEGLVNYPLKGLGG